MSRKWMLLIAFLLTAVLIWLERREKILKPAKENLQSVVLPANDVLWSAPDSNTIPRDEYGELIRYGKELISRTAIFLGPKGSISHISNGMTCQNCHLEAGTKAWAGNFGGVAALYPRFSERRGSHETVNQRITDCFERSMNGHAPDSNSREMKAMSAYILWLGKEVKKGKKPPGAGLEILPYIDRPADPLKGRVLFAQKCQKCHGANGEGQPDSTGGYTYPPLWGIHSYNTSAGLYRLSKFAGFIKDNMPFGSTYVNEQLSNEEAWDLAAFVNSQPRPVKKFKQDWPNLSLKPVDLAEGPFLDSFPTIQHKYGPYTPIAQQKKTAGTKKAAQN
jgi:thiosulfate dehydrogenase